VSVWLIFLDRAGRF